MKSTILSLLPVAGLAAAAESYCAPVKTYTTTEYETVYKTATPSAANVPSSTVSTCLRSTVTSTTYEKVYVTVTGTGYGPMPPKPTSTSTLDIYTTVTVRPSGSYCAATPSSAPFQSQSQSSSPSPSPSPSPAESKAPSKAPTTTLPSFTLAPAPTPSDAPSSKAPAADYPPAPEASARSQSTATGSNKGEATFYGGNLAGGMCSFYGYTLPSNLFGTALTDSSWDGANACGTCVSVTGPSGNKITAMVVDQCPGCGTNHVDLFPDAFKKLADPSKGVIPVSWEIVPCGITTPITLKNKSGTSAHWFSMQVMNANVQVTKLEVSTDGGKTWKGTKRQPYNFFENSAGFGTDSVDVKVTSSGGQSIIVKNVKVKSDSTTAGTSNFA